MKGIEIFIMLFTGSKNIDFSWRYVPKKLVFYAYESRHSRRFLGIELEKIENQNSEKNALEDAIHTYKLLREVIFIHRHIFMKNQYFFIQQKAL